MDTLAAGCAAGLVSTISLHPIDLIKVRFQVQGDPKVGAEARYTSVVGAARSIWRSEGLRGFYKGAVPALWGSGLTWGLYLYFYERSKHRTAAKQGNAPLSWWQHTFSAWESGSICVFLTNPLWLVKTRMQLQREAANRAIERGDVFTGPRPYRGMIGEWDILTYTCRL